MYNFGIHFLGYLIGSAKSAISPVNLLFDYLGVLIFYIRIGIHGIRLLMILGALAGLNEFMLNFSFPQKSFIGAESFWEELNGINFTLSSFSYFFLTTFPTYFIH
jgi:hypothetical protein